MTKTVEQAQADLEAANAELMSELAADCLRVKEVVSRSAVERNAKKLYATGYGIASALFKVPNAVRRGKPRAC